jgi:putative transposase
MVSGRRNRLTARFATSCSTHIPFATIEEARDLADAWKKDYNETRPHSALGGLTPLEYANKFLT